MICAVLIARVCVRMMLERRSSLLVPLSISLPFVYYMSNTYSPSTHPASKTMKSPWNLPKKKLNVESFFRSIQVGRAIFLEGRWGSQAINVGSNPTTRPVCRRIHTFSGGVYRDSMGVIAFSQSCSTFETRIFYPSNYQIGRSRARRVQGASVNSTCSLAGVYIPTTRALMTIPDTL
jgi:hypothetical protein